MPHKLLFVAFLHHRKLTRSYNQQLKKKTGHFSRPNLMKFEVPNAYDLPFCRQPLWQFSVFSLCSLPTPLTVPKIVDWEKTTQFCKMKMASCLTVCTPHLQVTYVTHILTRASEKWTQWWSKRKLQPTANWKGSNWWNCKQLNHWLGFETSELWWQVSQD